jgi:hypothetical protein
MTGDVVIRENRIQSPLYRLFPISSTPSVLRDVRLHCFSERGSRPFDDGADGEKQTSQRGMRRRITDKMRAAGDDGRACNRGGRPVAAGC